MHQGIKKAFSIAGILLISWIGIRFLLPLLFPFLLGGALALAAEPMVGFLNRRLKLRRGFAVGIGVTAVFCLLVLLILLLCALILRELGMLVGILPNLEDSLSGGLSALSAWALNLSSRLAGFFDGPNDGLVGQNAFVWGQRYTLLTVHGRRGISHGDMIDLNRENLPEFDVREFYIGLVSDLKQRGM